MQPPRHRVSHWHEEQRSGSRYFRSPNSECLGDRRSSPSGFCMMLPSFQSGSTKKSQGNTSPLCSTTRYVPHFSRKVHSGGAMPAYEKRRDSKKRIEVVGRPSRKSEIHRSKRVQRNEPYVSADIEKGAFPLRLPRSFSKLGINCI